ncbi:MAG: biopolymer transporter TolR [Opitutaceae bacterium]
MKLLFPVFLSAFALAAPLALAQPKPVGEFENSGDVGSPKLAGSAAYDAARQEYTFTGAGLNMWAARDEFQFAWRKTNGDFIVRTRVEFAGPGVDTHRKAGWIARTTLDHDAMYIDGTVHAGDGLTSLQFRRTKGGITEQKTLAVKFPDVLQLERRGNTYIFSAAIYGESFVSAEISDVDLGAEPLVGLFLCSHNADVVEQAVFRDVRITKPVKTGFTPYRDYIGSKLEILDVHSGKLETVHQSAEPFEAPNWTTDGRSLLVNISGPGTGPNRGRIRRFDLAARTMQPLDTGDVIRNNNDHVLSFDGKMLGLSSSGPGNFRSRVWILPSTGGQPKLVTPLAPSYLHGWSPDGKWVTYTGGRKEASNPTGPDKLDIYKVAIDGGDEVRLTNVKGMADGSEYSPDGKWIYYNSTESGLMQLWRMKPDGTGQEQLTKDEFNNWFPHISPNGKWIAFISYGQDIKPDDHPYYKHCYLRLMSIDGGPIKTIAYVYGGQGTINVPSWSPDSRRIAFVSNTDIAP